MNTTNTSILIPTTSNIVRSLEQKILWLELLIPILKREKVPASLANEKNMTVSELESAFISAIRVIAAHRPLAPVWNSTLSVCDYVDTYREELLIDATVTMQTLKSSLLIHTTRVSAAPKIESMSSWSVTTNNCLISYHKANWNDIEKKQLNLEILDSIATQKSNKSEWAKRLSTTRPVIDAAIVSAMQDLRACFPTAGYPTSAVTNSFLVANQRTFAVYIAKLSDMYRHHKAIAESEIARLVATKQPAHVDVEVKDTTTEIPPKMEEPVKQEPEPKVEVPPQQIKPPTPVPSSTEWQSNADGQVFILSDFESIPAIDGISVQVTKQVLHGFSISTIGVGDSDDDTRKATNASMAANVASAMNLEAKARNTRTPYADALVVNTSLFRPNPVPPTEWPNQPKYQSNQYQPLKNNQQQQNSTQRHNVNNYFYLTHPMPLLDAVKKIVLDDIQFIDSNIDVLTPMVGFPFDAVQKLMGELGKYNDAALHGANLYNYPNALRDLSYYKIAIINAANDSGISMLKMPF
jgi:hypothetical protein